jgi:cytochrome c oxidase subunit 2
MSRMRLLACMLLLAGCGGIQSALDPAGPGAASIGSIWWLMLSVCAAVYVAVMAMLLWAIARRRRRGLEHGSAPVPAEPQRERRMGQVVGVGVALTAAILIVFVLASFQIGQALTARPAEPALRIAVTAQRWWWDVRYQDPVPSNTFSTANEIHIPVGRPVELTLRSADVIHSFWVPNLHGKKDLIPGQINTLYVQADRPGVFRGQCAEFCGFQHANMALYVVAESAEEFERWQNRQRQPAPEPATDAQRRGHDVFMSSSCVLCHAISGTPAGGVTGPNLTHIASRLSLAAGTLPNTRAYLTSWVIDPQRHKPGNNMPPNLLRSEDLQALLSYLQTLR